MPKATATLTPAQRRRRAARRAARQARRAPPQPGDMAVVGAQTGAGLWARLWPSDRPVWKRPAVWAGLALIIGVGMLLVKTSKLEGGSDFDEEEETEE